MIDTPIDTRLVHVSQEPGITSFEPRQIDGEPEPLVWAIESRRLGHYLVPRDCPRIAYYAGPHTTAADAAHFLGTSTSVVVIEDAWFDRLQTCRLYCYRMPPETFECRDECAGYFVSRATVTPIGVEIVDDAIAELVERGVELRIVPSLWPLRDEVVASTLKFSLIRMRNAAPRPL